MTQRQKNQLKFWSEFQKQLAAKGNPFEMQSPKAAYCCQLRGGRGGFYSMDVLFDKNQMRVGYYTNDKDLFDKIAARKASIEKAFGASLVCDRNDMHAVTRIYCMFPGPDENDMTGWAGVINNAITMVEKFMRAVK